MLLPCRFAFGPTARATNRWFNTLKSLLVGVAQALIDLEQKPLAALGLVDNDLQLAGGCHITVLLAYLVRGSMHLCEVGVVFHQTTNHLTGRYELIVIILNGLQLADMADAANSRTTDAAHTFGQRVNLRSNQSVSQAAWQPETISPGQWFSSREFAVLSCCFLLMNESAGITTLKR